MLGLKRGTVKLVPFQSAWNDEFLKEKDNLQQILNNNLSIEHIGSTAVDGLYAKPIIDIIIGYKLKTELEYIVKTLNQNNYEDMGDRAVIGEHLFVKGHNDIRTHHLHVIEKNSNIWENYITFREYLREHIDARIAYNRLKQKLAVQFQNSREAYTDGKSEFINTILKTTYKL